jgi:uncharacterized membrane protein HdeD (DUF308 family)
MDIEIPSHWWTLAVRGLAAIIFGLLAWSWPDLTVTVLVVLFGAYALVDGALAIGEAIAGNVPSSQRLWLVLEGVAGIAVGIITLVWPELTATSLLYLIAAWAIVTGISELIAAVRLRRQIENEWLLGLSGITALLFGLLIAIFPGSGAVALVWLIGAFAIVFGALLIALALRFREWERQGRVLTVGI